MTPVLVVFDCDGTIVDSQAIICAAMERAFDTLQLEPPAREKTLAIVGLSLPVAIGRLIGDPTDPRVFRLTEAYKASFADLRTKPDLLEPMFEGAREALNLLAARDDVLMAVATGKSRRGLHAVLAHHGLDDHFHSLHTADDGPSKPHPAMLKAAMDYAGVAPDRTVMIGDTSYDVEMAVAAGAVPIGVTWGYHPEAALRQAGATRLVGAFSALPAEIDRALFGEATA